MDSFVEQSLLYDFYGDLLTEHQKEIYESYISENLSLAEIAQEAGISRQGVHDTIKRCTRLLNEYEEKLGLVKKFMEIKALVKEIENSRDLDEAKKTAERIIDKL